MLISEKLERALLLLNRGAPDTMWSGQHASADQPGSSVAGTRWFNASGTVEDVVLRLHGRMARVSAL
jgi:hypothetical protein